MEYEKYSGIILDINYVNIDNRSVIRITLKQGEAVYTFIDPSFYPYFYLVPDNDKMDGNLLKGIEISDNGDRIRVHDVSEKKISLRGKEVNAFKVETFSTRHVPKLSERIEEFGKCYENDILFWKRYLIDKDISALFGASVTTHKEGNSLVVDKIERLDKPDETTSLRHLCFDIETYNPMGEPRLEKDPIIMLSYSDGKDSKVISPKKIERDFTQQVKDEKELINTFINIVKEKDIDVLVGYNSSNFDIPYLMTRAKKLRVEFDISRYGEETKKEHHGLIDSVKIPGRINLDVYNVAKFVSIVGATEQLIRVNRLTLSEVHHAITGKEKKMVDKRSIWQQYDGTDQDVATLAEYSLSDSIALNELYKFFLPLEVEIAKISGTTLAESAISTAGQLVEYVLMRYAHMNNELIFNKPDEAEIARRLANPIEGAYVKTPEAGIYDNIAVFDFRGLYPSIIIAYNIDPSTLCDDCKEYFEAPNGAKFRKDKIGIVPKVLKLFVNERIAVKKAYKKDPDNKALAARSQALKILANSFYGYLGYARSRWYSRDCAAGVTSLGRAYIQKTISEAENAGYKVLYADTDSVFLLTKGKNREDVMAFLKKTNDSLPEMMELELDDFYTRGVFVGKRGEESGGAKKKYALLSESGRIKIKGFELVRRDWSSIARDTQRRVLETILKEGSKENAVAIVKDVIERLRSGKVELKELVINTQLRRKIGSYDTKSPELAAAKKAIEKGIKRREELEGATIGYIVTKNGNTISEKAMIEEMAENYDPDYYISHQVIPATLKILKELGFSEEELKGGGSQRRLGG